MILATFLHFYRVEAGYFSFVNIFHVHMRPIFPYMETFTDSYKLD